MNILEAVANMRVGKMISFKNQVYYYILDPTSRAGGEFKMMEKLLPGEHLTTIYVRDATIEFDDLEDNSWEIYEFSNN